MGIEYSKMYINPSLSKIKKQLKFLPSSISMQYTCRLKSLESEQTDDRRRVLEEEEKLYKRL